MAICVCSFFHPQSFPTATQSGKSKVMYYSISNRDLIGQFLSRDPMLECDWSTARAAARMPRHNMPPVLCVDLMGASSSK